MKLRPYQSDICTSIADAWATGTNNVMAVLPTGAGKTVCFSHVLHEHNGACVAIAHRQELVTQISIALAREGLRHRIIGPDAVIRLAHQIHMRELGSSFIDPGARCAVAGVDTLIRRVDALESWAKQVTLWVNDECFPAGTIVGGKPIEQLNVGDTVPAFNEKTGSIEQRKIVHTFKNPAPSHMMRVDLQGHHTIFCTSGHPFWTKRGWVNALDLNDNDEVLYVEMYAMRCGNNKNKRPPDVQVQKDRKHILHEKVRYDVQGHSPSYQKRERMGVKEGKTRTSDKKAERRCIKTSGICRLQYLRKTRAFSRLSWYAISVIRSYVLQQGVQHGVPKKSVVGNNDENKYEIRLGTDEKEQSNAQKGNKRQDVTNTQKNRTQTSGSGWKRKASYRSGSPFVGTFWRRWVFFKRDFQNWPWRKIKQLAISLQDRLWKREIEDCDRSGWCESQFHGPKATGQEERSVPNWVRVDSVKVFKPNDIEQSRVCNFDGYVYNIEVEGLHTYLANGIVVHNCHHIQSDPANKWGKAIQMFPNAKGLGVTATPMRADGKGLGRGQGGPFATMIEGPSMRWMIDNGFLKDYRIFAPPSDLDLSHVPVAANGDYSKPKLKAEVQKSHITGDVVEHYQRLANGRRGVTFATDVETATEIAERFNAAGVPAAMICAKTNDIERTTVIRKLASGELMQVVNVDLLGEGFDLPAISVVSMARPTQSYGLYCLDPDTEILTPEGWRPHGEIDEITRVVAWDSTTGKTKYVDVQSRVKRELYDGECMYEISATHLNISVTARHNMFTKSAILQPTWKKQTAVEMSNRKSLYYIPVAGFGDHKGCNLTKDELHLIGWFMSDGTINKKTNAMSVSQAINKKYHIEHIENAIKGCGFKYNKRVIKRKNCPKTHHDLVQFTISKGKPRGAEKHLTGWERLEAWLDKSVPECYDDLSSHEFKTLLEAWNLGDGTNNHNSLDYVKHTLTITCGDNKHQADRLQALCVQRGYRCNIASPQYEGRSMWFILHIRECVQSSIAGTNVKDGAISGKKKYKRSRFSLSNTKPSFVWCLSNELGTLITRRKGKVAIVGNCQQFGRALRLSDDDTAIIIDHVGNVMRHGLPDAPRQWSLAARTRTRTETDPNLMPMKTCIECMGVYEAFHRECPYCGHVPVPAMRNAPEFVDGDLTELDAETLARMRAAVAHVDGEFDEHRMARGGAPAAAIFGAKKQHRLRKEAQEALRDVLALWGGHHISRGRDIPEAQRRFYHAFGIDVLSAQALGRPDAESLRDRVMKHIEGGIT